MELGRLGVSEECIRPPDLFEHFIADAQLIIAVFAIEAESVVLPQLPEVELQSEVLWWVEEWNGRIPVVVENKKGFVNGVLQWLHKENV